MKKLKIGEIGKWLLEVKELVRDIVLATADFGVEQGGEPKHVRYRFDEIDYLDCLIKEVRNDLLDIRRRCISGFESRNDGQILSKFGTMRGEGAER
ncbi:MAG: hypothetical protein HWN68_09605 [Desulfobacterales bacterium]|nr:hypothetical protein [Desulfobacterales bacterium]